jgi:hypothetical protein
MPPKKKATGAAPARRSSRIAANEANAEAKMHAEALAATKDWFAEMGKEMQMAEDQEAAELFAQTVMEHEEKTGMVCVMLDSVEDDSDDDEDEEDSDVDESESDDEDEDDEPSEVSGSDIDNDVEDDENASDSDSAEDPLWAPDGMKERLENALKVYVPKNAAEALETLQMTLRLAEVIPGVGADLAQKVIKNAEVTFAEKDLDASFASAFAATVAMKESDPIKTWAVDTKRANALLLRLAAVWRALFLAQSTTAEGEGETQKRTAGVGRLEKTCRAALELYLGERCVDRWGEAKEGDETEPKPLGLRFDAIPGASGHGSVEGKKRARQ